jgi:hypothetical protein
MTTIIVKIGSVLVGPKGRVVILKIKKLSLKIKKHPILRITISGIFQIVKSQEWLSYKF